MDITEQFQMFLEDWVKQNYGQGEVDNPSWDIKRLSVALKEKFWELKDDVELLNITDDVLMTAEEHGIELRWRVAEDVADDYRLSESYCAKDGEAIWYFIEKKLKEGEDNATMD